MRYTNTSVLAVVLSLAAAAAPALAQKQGITPEFSDDDLLTYVEAEVDYTGEDGGQLRWDAETWIGGDYRKLWVRTDGDRVDGEVEEAQLQILYGGYLAPFWDWRMGLRHDFEPASLNYAVLGVKGLAPYRFETDASLFVSEEGDVSAELEFEYDLLLTQRLIAAPYVDLEVYAQDVPEAGKGAGLAEGTVGLRVRYEIRREIAPYLDVGYSKAFGQTADYAREEGEDTSEFLVRAGLRLWY